MSEEADAPAEPAAGSPRSGTARLLTGVAWAVLLIGLWLWGRGASDGTPTATGDVAAVGRPPVLGLPAAHAPLAAAQPRQVVIDTAKVRAPVVARGLDAAGGVAPPPYDRPGAVGWYRGGPSPGSSGAAVLVGHVDTDSRPAVFYHLSAMKPGEKVRVGRSDGSVAEFTVEEVEVISYARFDPRRVYGPRAAHRAELRLITCGGAFDRARHTYTANVVVSAYLTDVTAAPKSRTTAGRRGLEAVWRAPGARPG
ncbi:class F sortase [Streptomyces sp. SAJ15]|uniref:class F sortase n=1 Tax=Streptomyces sp. SAJ15 TaxID=2011095 RepID=UPI0011860E92|nr:class F sortase [Streptomyces sp. SAJ15]TVL89215.1 class F sortase [Streptomyces sp. SAJ15]